MKSMFSYKFCVKDQNVVIFTRSKLWVTLDKSAINLFG